MQKFFILALVITFASVCVTSYPTHGYKRGVVAVGVSCADLELLAEGASWFYQYGHAPDADIAACAHRLGLEFVPMQAGAGTIGSLGRDLPRDSQNFLGFNEPNSPNQANLSPEAAAQDWMNQVIPQLRQANYHGRIGTPSTAIGKTPGPLQWYTRFFAACTDCHFDFIAAHYYGDELFYLQQLVAGLHNRFNLPIWVTEFARPHTSEFLRERFMTNAVAWMEKTQYIERYAWFAARNDPSGYAGRTNLLQPGAATLTPLGRLYMSLPFKVEDSTTVTSSTAAISVTTSTTAGVTSSASASAKSTSTALASSTKKSVSTSKHSQSTSSSTTAGIKSSTSASVKSTSTGSVSASASTTKTSASTSQHSQSVSTSTSKASTIQAASAETSSSASAHKASTSTSTLAHA